MNLFKCLLLVNFVLLVSCGEEKPKVSPPDNIAIALPVEIPVPSIDTTNYLTYSWMDGSSWESTLINRIPCPEGFKRSKVEKSSFADWLRHFPLKSPESQVYLYNGALKSNQSVHHSVLDIDVGNSDLQQCADAVMRLYAEYQYAASDFSKIHFNFTSGHEVAFEDWMYGKKPIIQGNSVRFSTAGNQKDDSHRNFRKYMNMIYSYAGTASLEKELIKVPVSEIQIGDVFIQGGFPGHAIIVMDIAENNKQEKIFLLAQSYMPAQDIHILNNFNDEVLSPWYSANFEGQLYTPEWTFNRSDLKRFKDEK